MNCPIDRTTLEPHIFHTVEIEECPQCKGLWFKGDELRKAKDDAKPDVSWLDFDLWSNHAALEVVWSSRKCPACSKPMATISYASTGVTVDYCIERHGVWLDAGEFEAIIAALDAEARSKTAAEYVSASLEEAKEMVTSGEGFVSEWKDLSTVTRLLQYRILSDNPRLAELLFALQATTPIR